MQFNSFVFIMMFLPITVLAYFLANKWKPVLGKLVLAVASVVFYAYSDWTLFTVLGISLVVNLAFAWALQRLRPRGCLLLIVPVLINVGLLLYFKYTNFLIGTVNQFAGTVWAVRDLVQPLGIIFFSLFSRLPILSPFAREKSAEWPRWITFAISCIFRRF